METTRPFKYKVQKVYGDNQAVQAHSTHNV